MSIEFQCHCGSQYRLDDSRAGEQFTCRICGAVTALANLPRAVARPPAPGQAYGAVDAAEADRIVPAVAGSSPVHQREVPSGTKSQWERFGQTVADPVHEERHSGRPAVGYSPVVSTPSMGSRSNDLLDYSDMRIRRDSRPVPPMSWWVLRIALWGCGIGLFFLPWFHVSASGPNLPESVNESASGFMFVHSAVKGIVSAKQQMNEAGVQKLPLPQLSDLAQLGGEAARMVLGLVMFAVGPWIYAVGIVLGPILAIVAYKRDGRGAMWPFVVMGAGLAIHIFGWMNVAGNDMVSQVLEMASQAGLSIGISAWVYLGMIALVPMMLIARVRPDHAMEQLRNWQD